jgi:hypothetical protein
MKLRKDTVLKTLLMFVEHRDQRIKFAASLDPQRAEFERHQANEIMKSKFDEFLDNIHTVAEQMK